MYICTYTQVHTVSIVERSLFQILLTSPKPHTLGPQNGRPNVSENLKRSSWERTSVWQQCHHHLHHLLLLLQHLPLPVQVLVLPICGVLEHSSLEKKPCIPEALRHKPYVTEMFLNKRHLNFKPQNMFRQKTFSTRSPWQPHLLHRKSWCFLL